METQRLQKEAEAREQRLASMLSRLSHQELLTALSLLGAALNRDQSLFLSKRVAVKLSALGFGKPTSTPKTDADSATPLAASAVGVASDASHREPPSRSATPTMRHSQSPPPPPPPPPPATAMTDLPNKGAGSGGVDKVLASETGQRVEGGCEAGMYIGVTPVDAGFAADISLADERLHLGTFSTTQVMVTCGYACRVYIRHADTHVGHPFGVLAIVR